MGIANNGRAEFKEEEDFTALFLKICLQCSSSTLSFTD
jgi:hypothetical protein